MLRLKIYMPIVNKGVDTLVGNTKIAHTDCTSKSPNLVIAVGIPNYVHTGKGDSTLRVYEMICAKWLIYRNRFCDKS